jgi:2,3-bisphosphoglycerate-independent phosphoglycerate mutase
VEKRIHVRDAVPFAIRDRRQAPDIVERYDEQSCAGGRFGTVRGDQFIRAVFQK